jgi:hypothetical protein
VQLDPPWLDPARGEISMPARDEHFITNPDILGDGKLDRHPGRSASVQRIKAGVKRSGQEEQQ